MWFSEASRLLIKTSTGSEHDENSQDQDSDLESQARKLGIVWLGTKASRKQVNTTTFTWVWCLTVGPPVFALAIYLKTLDIYRKRDRRTRGNKSS